MSKDRTIDLSITIVDKEKYTVALHDVESNDTVSRDFPLGDREHKALNEWIGEEVYGWVDFMHEGFVEQLKEILRTALQSDYAGLLANDEKFVRRVEEKLNGHFDDDSIRRAVGITIMESLGLLVKEPACIVVG